MGDKEKLQELQQMLGRGGGTGSIYDVAKSRRNFTDQYLARPEANANDPRARAMMDRVMQAEAQRVRADILSKMAQGGGGSIYDVRNSLRRNNFLSGGELHNRGTEKLFKGYRPYEGDMAPTMRDRAFLREEGGVPSDVDRQRAAENGRPTYDGALPPTEHEMEYMDQFGSEALKHRGPGYIPTPQPRKPWLVPYGQFQHERSDGVFQELPPGVGVRKSDAYQIQKDFKDNGSSEDDEDIMNNILENIGKMPKGSR